MLKLGNVETYGTSGYSLVSIVRVEERDAASARKYGRYYYVLYQDMARVDRSYHYLRNARKAAKRLAASLG